MFVDIRYGVLPGIEDRFAVGASPVYELNHQKSWVALQQPEGSGQQCVGGGWTVGSTDVGSNENKRWAALLPMQIIGGQHAAHATKGWAAMRKHSGAR